MSLRFLAFLRSPSRLAALSALLAMALAVPAGGGERRNFYGMHTLMDGGAFVSEGMNWTRHMVGEGGYVFDWVRGDHGKWVVEAMDRDLIPCLRIQECNGGCTPNPGYPAIIVSVIREHLAEHRPDYANRIIYLQLWNEPGDPRDFVTPEDFADFLVQAHHNVKQADLDGVFRTMTPGQNGSEWWRRAIRHNPAVCQAFDVWATHPYPESYPPRYNHHDGVPYINQVKTVDSYLLDLDAVADECEKQGSPRRGFPVMITETAYGDHLGIAYEGYPKTTRGAACTTDGPCDFGMAADYNRAAFSEFWHKWPEVIAVHPFILNNWAWDHFAFVSKVSGSRDDGPTPSWCPPGEDVVAGIAWPPGYSQGAQRCGLPTAPYPQYRALLDLPKPPAGSLEPYRGPVGVLRGFVRRADTGEAVAHASLSTDGYEFGGPTLFDGQYVVREVPAGSYTLRVEKVGYGGDSVSVTVRAGEETVVDFDLAYLGKTSKGLYFQNQGTCNGCDLYAPFVGQTVEVPADVGFIKFAAAMPNVGDVTMRFTILEGGPTGPVLGPSTTAYLEWGGEMIGAEWPGDGVPVTPGSRIFLKVERDDGQGVYLYGTDSDPYPAGMVYTGTTPRPSWDLFATVRGLTVAVDPALGSLDGRVEDVFGAPLAGVDVRVAPGGQSTLTGGAGRYVFGAVPAGLHDVTASRAGYTSQTRSGVSVVEGQTTTVDFALAENVTLGALSGTVVDETAAPLAGATVVVEPGGHGRTTSTVGGFLVEDLEAGGYSLRVSLSGFEAHEEAVVVEAGATTHVDVALSPVPTPVPTDLIVNGDFSQGLQGWSTWVERGALGPGVNGAGQLHLSAVGHNGGVYQTFSTGGAGVEIAIDGFWASNPTAPQAQWAEVLVINGPRQPANGQDISAGQPDVVMVYKNDTWASPGGWSGSMDTTSPVASAGSFVAEAETATLILKSGNLLGVSSGALFDDVVVSGESAPPPNQAPTAVAQGAPLSGAVPLAVSFDGSVSSDPDGDALGFAWDFGDGAQGSGTTVSHTYATAGSFTATLTVDDGRGGTDSATLTVTAEDAPPPNQPPTAVASGAPLSGTVPLTVSFDGSVSSDPDGDALSFAWDFGDGTQGSGATVSHTYTAAGTFTVTLTVDDGRGGGDSTTLGVSAEDAPPGPSDLIVNGNFSQGLQGWSTWVERGALSPGVNGAGQLQLSAVGHNGGVYQTFSTGGAGAEIAIDGFWASSPTAPQAQWAEVLVINGPRQPANGQDVNAGQPDVVMVYKNDTWASPGGWSGSMDATSPVSSAGSFVAEGETATLVLKSGNLLGVSSGALFDDVAVTGGSAPPPVNRPPEAAATATPSAGVIPLAVTLDGSGSNDPDGDALSFAWDLGDGTRASGATVSHTYTTAGTFTATLTVDDGRGGTDSATLTVAASASPPIPGPPGWDPRLDQLGVTLVRAEVAEGTWYWKLESGLFESDGEILPPPGGGSESSGTHSIYIRALDANGNAIESQAATVSWPGETPTEHVTIRTKGAIDGFWGDFPMAGGSWCPFFPEGPRGPYGASLDGGPSDRVWGMGMPCNRHVSFRLTWRWTRKTADTAKSKLTIHAGFGGPLSMQFVDRAKPRIVKILDSFSAAPEIKRLSPETSIIGRAYLESQPMDGDPVQRAREWWDRSRGLVLQYPEIDYWEAYNEPIIQTPELMSWYAAFEAERVALLAAHGLKACIANFSTGNPDLPLWPHFFPAIDAARAHGGILGLHEYGTPMQQYFEDADDEGWLCGRYRKLYRQYLIPNDKVIPLAITETGVDVVPPVGWKNHFTEEEYLAQLEWYDRLLLEDDYVLGATIFALEIPGWWSFDIAPIVDRLTDYVAQPVVLEE